MAEKGLVPPATPFSRHSEQEIEQGLMSLALESGNTRRAAKRLAGMGMTVHHSTLHRWQTKHLDKYQHMQRDVLPRVRMEAAEKHSAYADSEMELGLKIITQLDESLPSLAPRDLSTALRNVDTGQGIHRDKAAALRGDLPPPQVNISYEAQVHSLISRGATFFDSEGNRLQPEEAIAKGKPALPPGDTKEPKDTE